jgi:ABC-type uncharacterized transport system substrate-binding protein
MRPILHLALTILLLGGLLAAHRPPALADNGDRHPITPRTNGGKKWRIGYLEGGHYLNYPITLRAIAEELAALGWMEKISWPKGSEEGDARLIWNWLATHAQSAYLTFLPDAFWSAEWQDRRRAALQAEVLQRLDPPGGIDLMLAMGTWAGQDLANDRHRVPTVVLSTSNPVQSNIIPGAHDSGRDHIHARVDPARYERQLRIFHGIFGFKRLGIALEQDTPDGRTYAALDDVNRMARELGFEVLVCPARFSNVSRETARQEVLACHRSLAHRVDAFYLTVHRGLELERMAELVAPFLERRVPTFSQRGTEEVAGGALLSIARAGFRHVGRFHAETIARIFNGAKPRDLEQVFEDPPRIAINLKSAQIIGYDPTVDILGSADEIYESIAQHP